MRNTIRVLDTHRPRLKMAWSDIVSGEVRIEVAEKKPWSADEPHRLLFGFDDDEDDVALTAAILGAHPPTFATEIRQPGARNRLRSLVMRCGNCITLASGATITVRHGSANLLRPIPIRPRLGTPPDVRDIPTIFRDESPSEHER